MSWFEERNKRWEKERQDRENRYRDQGYKMISCVAAYNPATGEHPMCSWTGETESLYVVNPSFNVLDEGIGCVLISASSFLLDEQAFSALPEQDRKTAVRLTVFKGTHPR